MQHVIRHWQGSLTEADSTAAMQMDAEFDKARDLTPVGTRSQTREIDESGELVCGAQLSIHVVPSDRNNVHLLNSLVQSAC